MKMNKVDLERMRSMLTDAITVMLKSGLAYKSGFSVEGLLGVTMHDDDQVFLVNIKESIRSEPMFPREAKRRQSYVQDNQGFSSSETEVSSDDGDSSPSGKPKRKRRKPQKISQSVNCKEDVVVKEEEEGSIRLSSDNESNASNWMNNIMSPQQNPRLQPTALITPPKQYSQSSNGAMRHQTPPSHLYQSSSPQFPGTSSQLFPTGQTLPGLSSILGGSGSTPLPTPSASTSGGTSGPGPVLPDLSAQPDVPVIEDEMVKVSIPIHCLDYMGNPTRQPNDQVVIACLRPNPGPGRVRLLESSPISVERDQLVEALRKATYKKEAGYYLMYRLLFLTVGKETLAYCNGPGKRHSDRPSLSDDLINTCKAFARAFCHALGRPVPQNVVLGRAFTVARQNASRPEWKQDDPPDHMAAWNRILQDASQQLPSLNTTNQQSQQAAKVTVEHQQQQQDSSPSQFYQQVSSMSSLRSDASLSHFFPPTSTISMSSVKSNQN